MICDKVLVPKIGSKKNDFLEGFGMNELIIEDDVRFEKYIYEVRGQRVMLDSDLAMFFEYETKQLNRQVARNIKKFPENYCFRLTEQEYEFLRCNFLTSSNNNSHGGRRYLPYVFTEYGIVMLAGILKSDVAIKMSLRIVDTFITMRRYINTNLIEQRTTNKLVLEYDKRISNTETKIIELDNNLNLLQESFNKLNTKESNNHIFYEGQIYDSYSLLIDILSRAKKEIIIIDNYAGKKLFDIIKNINVKVKIYTENIDNISKEKYEKQYNNLEIINTHIFHDRFIIIDNKVLYHSGASFKDLGKKCFAITKIEDNSILKELLNKIL